MSAASAFAGAFIGERIAAVPDTGGGWVYLIPHIVSRGRQFGMLRQHPFDGLIVTPHVLRHTFCTNAQQAGLDVKSLQYLMGHSNASVTLDVYTHSNYESVEKAFEQVAANL